MEKRNATLFVRARYNWSGQWTPKEFLGAINILTNTVTVVPNTHTFRYMCTHTHTHTHIGPQLFSVQRKLLLALQWSNFKLEPSDLRLLFGTNLDLYSRVVSLSGVVTSCVDVDMPMPSSRLASRLRMACVLMMQLLSVQVG